MANTLQKIIYNLSAISPLCFIIAVIWYAQKHTLIVPAVCMGIGIVLILCLAVSLSYAKKHLAPIIINVTNISPHDVWVVVYFVFYMIPCASIVIEDFNIVIYGIFVAIFVVIVSFTNLAIPNPVLMWRGYHFYKISAGNGISGYLFVTNRQIRKAKDITTIKRFSDFLLIDTERQ